MKTLLVCAHGAGGHKDDRGMVRLAGLLEAAGMAVLRFNFAYRERGTPRIDPMPQLQATFREHAERARAAHPGRRLLLGGRSMGGRVATMLAAGGFACDGLVLAAYPLHPAGKPEKRRDVHLPEIACPVLCLNGTRDALCRRELMEQSLKGVRAPWRMHWIEGADHSFSVLKSSGRSDADVEREIVAAVSAWLMQLPA